VILYEVATPRRAGRVFEHRVLDVGTEIASGHAHPSEVRLRAPDGTQVVLPASVVVEMIDAGHSVVRFGSEQGLVGVRAVSCRACGSRVLDLEASDPPASPHPALTTREREIFALLCQGLTNREISSRLWISEGTVKAHVGNVFRKLGVSNRTQAVVAGLSQQPAPARGTPGSPNVQPTDMRMALSRPAAALPLSGDDTTRRGALRIVR
jgi:DNA-binding NarL/FixJ family response regulator